PGVVFGLKTLGGPASGQKRSHAERNPSAHGLHQSARSKPVYLTGPSFMIEPASTPRPQTQQSEESVSTSYAVLSKANVEAAFPESQHTCLHEKVDRVFPAYPTASTSIFQSDSAHDSVCIRDRINIVRNCTDVIR